MNTRHAKKYIMCLNLIAPWMHPYPKIRKYCCVHFTTKIWFPAQDLNFSVVGFIENRHKNPQLFCVGMYYMVNKEAFPNGASEYVRNLLAFFLERKTYCDSLWKMIQPGNSIILSHKYLYGFWKYKNGKNAQNCYLEKMLVDMLKSDWTKKLRLEDKKSNNFGRNPIRNV